MGRWSQYDEVRHPAYVYTTPSHYKDEARLPEGMTRVGYDAETQKYTYQDRDGSSWEGPEGSRYGQLTKGDEPCNNGGPPNKATTRLLLVVGASTATPYTSPSEELLAVDDSRAIRKAQEDGNREAWRMMMSFFLLVGVCLLLVFYLVTPSMSRTQDVVCTGHSQPYTVLPGDSCWKMATDCRISIRDLLDLNPAIDCDRLEAGKEICVPPHV